MSFTKKTVNWLKNNMVPLVLGLLMIITVLAGAWNTPEVNLYDTWFSARGPADPGKNIVIVAMDERSMSELGPLPWPRGMHQALMDRIAGAKVVAFDLIMEGATDPANDGAMMEGMQKYGNVVLSLMKMDGSEAAGGQTYIFPYEPLMGEAAGLGFNNIISERGNVVRRLQVVDLGERNQVLPSFSMAVLMAYEGLNPNQLQLQGNVIRVGKHVFHVNDNQQMMMNFWGPTGTYPTYSYSDVLNGRVDKSVFKDAIVLIGPFSPTEQRYAYQTPFTRGNMILASGAPTPGVEIHASTIKTYMTGAEFTEAPLWLNIIILLISWFLVVWFARRTSPWAGFAVVVGLIAVMGVSAYLSWLKLHIWVYAVAPMAMVGVNYLGITVDSFIRVELERRKTRAVFSRYLSSNVVDQIMASGGEIELGGVKQEVTIMLVDIRGFTAFSEGKDPQVVLARLNEYLTVMTRIIYKHGGTLDKYTGDGLMAFFGAPVPQEDHADRGVRVAVEVEEQIGHLNEIWTAKGDVPLLVAVGVNTGPAVVGNVGSPERMDYTLIGDDVGLASDMEGSSKRLQTLIVVSERTYSRLKDESLMNMLVKVGEEDFKGTPIGCYTVTNMDLHFEKSTDKGFK